MPRTDLVSSLKPESDVLELMGPAQARRYRALPLRRAGPVLVVAMADPRDLAAVEEIEFMTGLEIRPIEAAEAAIGRAIDVHYVESRLPVLAAEARKALEEETPGVRIQRILFAEAIRLGASDLHIDPGDRATRVRFRVDGLLGEGFAIPRWLHERIVARIKVMGRLDISERRLPQDGHITDPVSGFEARLSTLPTERGEAVVLRVFRDRGALPSLSEIGGGPDLVVRLRAISRRPQGILIVAGPTGSGKTTTLYAIINELRGRSLNIVTIEDPVEYRVDGVRQVQVSDRSSLTFQSALRATLRQDPDVILVGEIRDPETARIAFHAGLTGHLVLTTLHATEAASTLTRLVELGVEKGVIASAMIGAVAQRLVRINCERCLVPDRPEDFYLERLGIGAAERSRLRRSRGCIECQFTGTSGRKPLFEVLELDRAVRRSFLEGREEDVRGVYVPLMRQAIDGVLEGRISTEEAYRTCYFGDVQ